MSNINDIAVLGALFIAAGVFSHHVIMSLHRKSMEITTGVAHGVTIPLAMRWRTLLLVYAPVAGFMGAMLVILAFAFWAIGQNLHDVDVQTVAQLCAYVLLCMAGMYLIGGLVAILGIASMLRGAKRD